MDQRKNAVVMRAAEYYLCGLVAPAVSVGYTVPNVQ